MARIVARRPGRMIVPLALACIAAAALLGCGEPRQAASPEPAGERVPEQEIHDYRLIESAGGVRRWVLQSRRLQRFPGEEEAELLEVRMDFYRDGEYYSTLTSRRGRANLERKQLFAYDDVVVTTIDGKRLETEELHYDSATGQARNDVFNRFRQGGSVVTGYGMEAAPDLSVFELKRQVDATLLDEIAAPPPAP